MRRRYDVIIIGSGHNGLVATAYLVTAGLSVLVLEKRERIGGATVSQEIFPGMAARPSVFSYLVSLLPRQICDDLALDFSVVRRAIASYTPYFKDGQQRGLLISNQSEEATRQSFKELTGNDNEYQQYRELLRLERIMAEKIWPTMLAPLVSRQELKARFITPDEQAAWQLFIEEPLGTGLEKRLQDDIVRGVVFTDAKIGMLTDPADPTLLQNKTFLYHIIGNGDGEWNVPKGGMGQLPAELEKIITAQGGEIEVSVNVRSIEPGEKNTVTFLNNEGIEQSIETDFVLCNAAPAVLERLLPGYRAPETVTGAAFKINMLVKELPKLKSGIDPRQAFAGTFHIDEGYGNMQDSFQAGRAGRIAARLPGEMYCHTLSDDSILSPALRDQGYHTLTFFGLDTAYEMFTEDNEAMKQAVLERYIEGLNRYLVAPLEEYLARDSNGQPCIEAKSALDIENELGMPRGNIFQGNLQWPFAESMAEAGQRGVETNYPRVFLCGAGARRGGGVSGIAGYHAAQAVLERIKAGQVQTAA